MLPPRLLIRAVWDTFAAMAEVGRFAVAGLEGAARRPGRRRGLVVGALDETSQVKAGTATAGVKRHYPGCAGKVANGITTVHLSCVRERTGHALAGARQRIPREHVDDPVRPAAAGLPADLVFRTKGQLAIGICAGVLDDGVRFDFICGDEVHGNCTELREFLEGRGRGQGYVLRVRSDFHLTLAGRTRISCADAARLLADDRWEVRPGRDPRATGWSCHLFSLAEGMAHTRWPSDPRNPGLLPRPGRSDR
jgi:hypothetical protein